MNANKPTNEAPAAEASAPTTVTPDSPQVVLLAKEHDITDFASNDPSRYVLNGVHYDAKGSFLEATNGRILIRVPVEKSEDFPPISGTVTPAPDCIIPLKPFKKALASMPNRSSLPVLQNVALTGATGKASGGEPAVRLTTTDLDTEQSAVVRAVEGNYPKTEQVIPTDAPKFTIALSAVELQRIADYFAKHGATDTKTVVCEFTEALSPARFHGQLASGKTAHVVLMPVRMS